MEKEINIKKLFEIIKKRFWVMIVTVIITLALSAIYNIYFTKPQYESSSRIIINAEPELMNTLMVMIKEPSFLEHVIEEMELNKTPEELSKQISAGSIGGSTIVKISVFDTNPEMATKIANTTAIVFKEKMPILLGFTSISILSDAKANPYPINDNQTRNILIGFLVGLISGVGIIFIKDFLDDTIRSEEYLEELLGVPVLGSISKMNKKKKAINKHERYKVEVWGESLGD
ncbi:Wzz/FepE/Etk N-terminal domain-containing protein [Neobacillus niacini]|uniref:YveK family protein n=1 Tax=Neobacillus niacini TaxID=86668 RepID=UPI002FFDD93A